jgi:ribosomal protein S18 acetylase RimI-like enzyme
MIALAAWESAFFGVRTARLEHDAPTEADLSQADAWCAAQHIALCAWLSSPDRAETHHLATRFGWQMMDFRVTLDHDLRHLPAPKAPTRTYREDDLRALERIARTSFTDSRLTLDPYFPAQARVADMYGAWLRRRCGDASAEGTFAPADHVVVADHAGLAAGFVTCVLRPPSPDGQRMGVVDLVAVDSGARGLYIGESMVCAALAWFKSQGCTTVEVVTQGRNTRAQRTYNRCGFLIRRAQTWYHKWYIAPQDTL